MKLAFTTLGCLNWNIDTIISAANEYGFQGIDFRGYMNELNVYTLPEFSTHVRETKTKIKNAGLEVSCFSSSVRLIAANEEEFENFEKEICEYAKLCGIFETKYIRVFGGGWKGLARHDAIATAAENMEKLLKITEDSSVIFAVETHDEWVDSSTIKDLMEKIDSPRVKVVWDVNHPYCGGETPEKTYMNIGKWVQYTHWKDSKFTPGEANNFKLCLPGEGDLPLKRFMELLNLMQYNSWLTLEWEKKWHPELPGPEVAFPAFVNSMNRIAD